MATAYLQTVYPGAITSFFDEDNVLFIQQKITEKLSIIYQQKVLVDIASIKRIMQRVYEARHETVPKMNQRVIMTIMNEFNDHQLSVNKHLTWEAHYQQSQKLYDASTARGPDLQGIKLANRLGKPDVGGTQRFYFT
jgi:hypothetical protein